MTTLAQPLFDRGGWWDPACREFASLRAVTEYRLQLLRQWLPGLAAMRTVDLGCGGGLLAVPLARAGAAVVGVDVARQALRAAHERRAERLLPIAGDLHAVPIRSECAELVLLADVLEHIAAPDLAVAEAARLLRPGGHLFVNTINRTLRSRLFAIWLGEGLGFVPRGTHEWAMFIRPQDLDTMAAAVGLRRVRQEGESPRLWATLRSGAVQLRRGRSLAVGYAALFQKASV
ncbi:MAG: bifunctional 2-polyprenyl-6-hydroxyphenol methylase/3-demethylubiquinol 3-O-methyltransferase UbiG [Planctomycetes bacterium]|nr:bifunctional 2-polyprenyl-6-hydroxyphenol methylase/3-demethylubiquinol 3-O-methyltransferase UbiG [Planctomycetota bacterium]